MSRSAAKGAAAPLWAWFAAGVASTLPQLLHPAKGGFGTGWEMLNVARALAAGRGFSDPFQIAATGPTAMVPPLYPAALSLLLRGFGDTVFFAWAAMALCLLMHGAVVALLVRAGERLMGDIRAGQAAAALACLIPAFPFFPQWDTAATTAGLLAFLLVTAPARPAGWFGWGAFAGALALLNPAIAPITGLRAVWLAPRARRSLALLACFALGWLAAAGPWMARNHATVGTWNLRTNFGTTFYTSNNDCAVAGIVENFDNGCYDRTQANRNLAEALSIARDGEGAYDGAITRRTLAWFKAHPGRAASLTWERFLQFWFPPAHGRTPYAQAVWAITLLGFAGVCTWRAYRGGFAFLAAVAAVGPLPYYFVFSDIRYRAPFLWLSQLSAGCLVVWLWRRFSSRRR